MAGKSPTVGQAGEAPSEAVGDISDPKSGRGTPYAKHQDAPEAVRGKDRRLARYENADSSPPAGSIECRRIGRQGTDANCGGALMDGMMPHISQRVGTASRGRPHRRRAV